LQFVIGILAVVAGAYFWISRSRNAAMAVSDLVGVAEDVMSAARRFGFRRRANIHPVESLEDSSVAISAIGIAYLELGGLPRAEQHEALLRGLQVSLGLSHEAAQEALVLGRWLVGECGGPMPGMDRLTRRLWKLKGAEAFEPLMQVLKGISEAGGNATSGRQQDALAAIAQSFGIA
jgi:hypothetical protein